MSRSYMHASMQLQMPSLFLLVALLVGTCHAKPLSVPYGTPNVTDLAQFNTQYPNPKITSALCQYETKGIANVVAVHQHHIATKVPDHNVFIELATGRNPLVNDGSTGTILDVNNPSSFVSMLATESAFCGATTHTKDGKMISVGGHVARNVTVGKTLLQFAQGLGSIRILDALNDNHLNQVQNLTTNRWYPSVHLLADGQVIINGGTVQAGNIYKGTTTAEIWNPQDPSTPPRAINMTAPWLASFENKPWYPFMWQMPTGHVFLFADNNSCILNHHTGKCVTDSYGNQITPPPRPGGVASTYPFTGSAVIAKLTPNTTDNTIKSMDLIVFGGAKRSDHPNHTKYWGSNGYNVTARASRLSHRITISWRRHDANSKWNFKFSNWTEEDMGYPRVMPDATLLPNGDVTILNGCQAGVAGYQLVNVSISQYPAFWASLYQPDRTAQKRYTMLCGTTQPRGYHGSASLTTEGKIVVAGHDRPRWYYPMPNVPWFVNGTDGTVGPAYKVEMFWPPYVYDTANKPAITAINGQPPSTVQKFNYNTTFTLEFAPAPGAGAINVTSVTLVAPTSVTHQNNMNQRVIQLNFKQIATGKLTVTTPLHPFYAVPQYYMLFINNVKTYSTAAWVQMIDPLNLGSQVPKP